MGVKPSRGWLAGLWERWIGLLSPPDIEIEERHRRILGGVVILIATPFFLVLSIRYLTGEMSWLGLILLVIGMSLCASVPQHFC